MAKIYGELVSAQLENLIADPVATSLGRLYHNSVAGAIRYWDGSAWIDVIDQTALDVTLADYQPLDDELT